VSSPAAPWTVESVAARPAYSVVDVRLAAGVRIPPHVNRDEDLVVHLVGGEVELVLDGDGRRLLAGAAAAIPRGRPRRLTALTDAHLLLTSVPGGIHGLAAIATDVSLDPDDRAALLAAAGVVRVPAG
jgi:quercetin dioxygenase-like cupin family protein